MTDHASNPTTALSGFGNHFASEAVPGALPQGRNSPQRVALGPIALIVGADPKKVLELAHGGFGGADEAVQRALADAMQPAKSMMVAFLDAQDKSALRIDLWTKDMMVDEMADFYYQTFMGMADTFQRATQQTVLVEEMKAYAKDFYKKFRDIQLKENK